MTVSAPPYFLPISTPNMGHIAHWPRSGPHQTRSFGLTVSYDGTWAVDSAKSESQAGHTMATVHFHSGGLYLAQTWASPDLFTDMWPSAIIPRGVWAC